jgi:Tfp pilus assembly major pilin PilA
MIAAVLGAIAYPMYSKAITKTRAAEAVNLLEMVYNKQAVNFTRTGEYLDDFNKIGKLTTGEEKVLQSGASVEVNGFTLTLNSEEGCVSARYGQEDSAKSFIVARNYVSSDLGCSGNSAACAAFVGALSAEEVCSVSGGSSGDDGGDGGGGDDGGGAAEPACSGDAPEPSVQSCGGGKGSSSASYSCQGGQWVLGDFGDCVCEEGYKLDGDVCVIINNPFVCVSQGKVFNEKTGACDECSSGTSIDGKTCIPIITPEYCKEQQRSYNTFTRSCCPKGSYFDGKAGCVSCDEYASGAVINDAGTACVCPADKPWRAENILSAVGSDPGYVCRACPEGSKFDGGLCACQGGRTMNLLNTACVCPADKPNWNGLVCLACTTAMPVWSFISQKCEACPTSTPVWNAASKKCEVCPASAPVWNAAAKKCEACPSDKPLWNGSACTACPSNKPVYSGGVCTCNVTAASCAAEGRAFDSASCGCGECTELNHYPSMDAPYQCVNRGHCDYYCQRRGAVCTATSGQPGKFVACSSGCCCEPNSSPAHSSQLIACVQPAL